MSSVKGKYPRQRTEEDVVCALCGAKFQVRDKDNRPRVCDSCDQAALNKEGRPARAGDSLLEGDNPVFIRGKKCWRKYRPATYSTYLDLYDSHSIEEFFEKSFSFSRFAENPVTNVVFFPEEEKAVPGSEIRRRITAAVDFELPDSLYEAIDLSLAEAWNSLHGALEEKPFLDMVERGLWQRDVMLGHERVAAIVKAAVQALQELGFIE